MVRRKFLSEFVGLAVSAIPPVLCMDFSYHKLGRFEAAFPRYIISPHSINKKICQQMGLWVGFTILAACDIDVKRAILLVSRAR